MTQLGLKQGIKTLGVRAEDEAFNEMKQLHDMVTFFPRDPKTLTHDERIQALSSLLLLKEKTNKDKRDKLV